VAALQTIKPDGRDRIVRGAVCDPYVCWQTNDGSFKVYELDPVKLKLRPVKVPLPAVCHSRAHNSPAAFLQFYILDCFEMHVPCWRWC
jgi:hypothetical protein